MKGVDHVPLLEAARDISAGNVKVPQSEFLERGRLAVVDQGRRLVAGMSLDNVLVRPHRHWVERYAERGAWSTLTEQEATGVREHLAGLPSAANPGEEEAKRFDLLVLRSQLARLEGDAVTAERSREAVQAIAVALLDKLTIPLVAAQRELLGRVATDDWWVDVTLPMLEHARLRLRGLVGFVERTARNPVYTDFADTLGESVEVALPGTTPGTNADRFRTKAAAYLHEHESHVALQRLRRNRQLTAEDMSSLERMLLESGAGGQADIDTAADGAEGLGLFVRSLVGLERDAAVEAFARYLDDSRFTVDQVRFVGLIVDELTRHGVMRPGRLYQSPYTDGSADGVEFYFPADDVEVIVDILHEVRDHARPEGAA